MTLPEIRIRFRHSPSTPADVAVIGMGYVGLPLSLQFAGSGVSVLGVDIDAEKVVPAQQGRELYQTHRIRD